MLKKQALLMLEDGSTFYGKSIGISGIAIGEVVFNTAMTGYQEIITDPSYSGQLVTMTYPHIGNTGINHQDNESKAVHINGLIIKNLPYIHSNWQSHMSLQQYLQKNSVVAIADIDTRKLTRKLRNHGALKGCIMTDKICEKSAIDKINNFSGLAGCDLAKEVTTESIYTWTANNKYQYHIIAYDFGIKYSILNQLSQHDCCITIVPATTSVEQVFALKPDGIFLSNGPGDPEPCNYAIETIQKLMITKIPIFGICLGYQLLALACGARTIKMKFGHHGANHPIQELASGKVFITSQNHSFAVDDTNLPDNLTITHRSLFDQSLQGISCKNLPAFGLQGHPEAGPGPADLTTVFDKFIESIKVKKYQT